MSNSFQPPPPQGHPQLLGSHIITPHLLHAARETGVRGAAEGPGQQANVKWWWLVWDWESCRGAPRGSRVELRELWT